MGHVCLPIPLTEVKLLPFHRNWEIGALSFSVLTFQRDDPRSLERRFWVVKLARGWEEIYIPRGRERIYNCKFSKVNAQRKGSI